MAQSLKIPDPDPRLKKRYYLEMTVTRQVATGIARALFAGFAVMDVRGAQNLPLQGPVIVAANHLNLFDVFPLQFALPRPLFFMGKAELFHPALDPLFRRMGGFPVYRGESDQWAIEHAHKVLDQGQVLGIFPEGTRSQGKGLRTAKTGAARLALTANCPVVPAAIYGQEALFKHFPRRTPVTVSLGEPLWPRARESALELTDRMMFALAAQLPIELRGVYRERPPGF